jgi:hypothetical protein
MGPAVSRLTDAVTWSGRGAVLSLFVVFPPGLSKLIEGPSGDVASRAGAYRLEDVDERLLGRECYEYDLSFDGVPPNLESIVVAWLDSALEAGADVAWFAFEGSFDFNHVLTTEVASQVFAVGSRFGIELAIEDRTRLAAGWASKIGELRERVGL